MKIITTNQGDNGSGGSGEALDVQILLEFSFLIIFELVPWAVSKMATHIQERSHGFWQSYKRSHEKWNERELKN